MRGTTPELPNEQHTVVARPSSLSASIPARGSRTSFEAKNRHVDWIIANSGTAKELRFRPYLVTDWIMDVPRNMGSRMENVALLSALMVIGVRNSRSTQPAPMMLAIPSSAMDCVAALAAALRPTEGTALAMPLLRVLVAMVERK